jgi:hypothetical protein
VDASAQHTEDEDREGKQEQTSQLATTFSLPASCERSGRLWHRVWNG